MYGKNKSTDYFFILPVTTLFKHQPSNRQFSSRDSKRFV